MEDLKEAARYYLKTASDEYKQRAFKALDNGESLEDFYIRETKRSIRRCDVCAKLVVGFYFCCTKCELYKGCNYNLCVKCFYGGTFQHEHDSFADNHSVLMMHHEGRGEPSCVIEEVNGKGKQGLPIVASLRDSDRSNSIRPVSRLRDLNHSNSIRIVPSLLDSSNSNWIRHVSSLRDSGHSNSESIHTVPSSNLGSIRTIPSSNSGSIRTIPSFNSGSICTIPSSNSGSIRTVPSFNSGSIRTIPSSNSGSIRTIPSSNSRSIRTFPSLLDSSLSNSLPPLPNLRDSGHSNSLRRVPSLLDSSHSNSLPPIPSLRDSGHSNSLRRAPPILSLRDSGHSNSLRRAPPIPSLRDSGHSNSLHRALSLLDSSRSNSIVIDKEGIEKLAYIAEAHYNSAPQKIRDSADKFFWSMVKQSRKTSVTMKDFLESMNEKGYPEYAIPELFQILVKDSNLGMTMLESRSVYYILLSGRPFCSWCKIFIPADIYFCCSNCSAKKYALCLHCYANKAYVKHCHFGYEDVFFFDYTILHTTIKTTSATSYQETGSIVKTDDGKNKLKTALNVVKAALNVGGTVLSIASTFGACTIM